MGKRWPDEVIGWLKENVAGRTTRELTALINLQGFDRKYGMAFTEGMVKGAKSRYGFRSGTPCGNPKGYSPKFPEGMGEYIRGIATGRTTREIAGMVSEHFGIAFSVSQCRAYKKNHGIESGLDFRFRKGNAPHNRGKKMPGEVYEKVRGTMFRKGNVPANHMEVGEHTVSSEGQLLRKVQEHGTQRERWKPVHRLTWEEHNGPIPEGKIVSFLDGDKGNCDIENLVLLSRAESLELSRSRLRFSDADLTKAGVGIARIKVAARRRKGGDRRIRNNETLQTEAEENQGKGAQV